MPSAIFYKWLFLFLVLGVCLPLSAQDISDPDWLQAKGDIPQDFLYIKAGKKSDKSGSNAYLLNRYLRSGKVLFNDEISEYLSELMDLLLADQKLLRDSLRVYTIKSPAANAFMSAEGILLVNLGLLARLENEAQLAFVLAHEITHFTEKHRPQAELGGIDPDAWEGKALSGLETNPAKYAQAQELSADRGALQLLQKNTYRIRGLGKTYTLLAQPFWATQMQALDWQFFEQKYFSFAATRKVQAPNVPLAEPEADAQGESHPSNATRSALLEQQIDSLDQLSGASFRLPQARFERVRHQARLACCQLSLLEKEYEAAMLMAYQLAHEQPLEPYFRKVIAQGLYYMAKYGNVGKLWDVHAGFEGDNQAAQELSYWIETLRDRELCLWALSHVWSLHMQYPDDSELAAMFGDLLQELKYHYLPRDFSIERLSEAGQPRTVWSQEPSPPILSGLQAFLQDSLFVQRFEKILAAPEHTAVKPDLIFAQDIKPNESQKQRMLQGQYLGIEHLVLLGPEYQVQGSRSRKLYAEREQVEQVLAQELSRQAGRLAIEHEMLNTRMMQAQDAASFNHFALLQDWLTEQLTHQDLELVSPYLEEVQELVEIYETPYFVWTGMLTEFEPRNSKGIVITAGVLLPPVLPYSIYYATTDRRSTLFYALVYDLSQGKALAFYPRLIRMKTRQDVIASQVYDLLLQIHHP